jgi:5-methylcytosine-specific restriction endonuclease McrA
MPRAPKQCGINGCVEIVPNGQRCEQHKHGWKTSPRTASSLLHQDKRWKPFRAAILARDGHLCQIRYPGRCTGTATTVDLIQPAAHRPDLSFTPSNARAACRPCNEHKGRTTDRKWS